MDNLALSLISAILMGLGATLTFDLWGLFLKHTFRITPSNICLVGRWLRYMPAGTFKHSNIVSAPPKSAECTVGWIRSLHDWQHVRQRFRCISRQQLASASNADFRNRLRDCHGLGAILYHATFIWARVCCIKDAKSYAGKTS
jgi:Protein of unknown function (DUF2938)